MKILRHKQSGPDQRRIVWQAASLLLAYPDDDQNRRLDLVQTAVAGLEPRCREPLLAAVDHLRSM